MPDFEVGTAIEARFGGDEHYYSGVIQAAYKNGTYDIAYDDGDQENGVPHSLVRVRDVDVGDEVSSVGTEAKATGVALNSSEVTSPDKSGGMGITSASLSPSDSVVTSALANLPASSIHGGVEMSTTVPSSPPIVVDLGRKPPRIPLGGGSLSADEYDDEFVQVCSPFNCFRFIFQKGSYVSSLLHIYSFYDQMTDFCGAFFYFIARRMLSFRMWLGCSASSNIGISFGPCFLFVGRRRR